MTDYLNLLWILVVLALFSWAIGNVVAMAFAPLVDSSRIVTERRQLLVLAVLPWIFPLLAIASLLLLSYAKNQGWIHHHCELHQPHHPHFCLEHLPELGVGAVQWLVIGLLSGGFLLFVTLRMARQYVTYRHSRALQSLFRRTFTKITLDQTVPLAFTVGVRKPLVVMSHGLQQLLSKRQQRMVVKHEIAHVRNKDVLKNSVFEGLLSLHVVPGRLRMRWHLTAEILADQLVCSRFDALDVADVLVKLGKSKVNSTFLVSVSGGNLSIRVNRLLNPVSVPKRVNFAAWVLGFLLVLYPVSIVLGHHGLETFWGWLL